MYYKKQGSVPPAVKIGCAYEESYFFDGYTYLKYALKSVPSEALEEISQEEYEVNKPVIPEPEPMPPEPLSPTEQTLMQMAINMEYITTMMELKQ